MTAQNPREIPFAGVRLRFDSERTFDNVSVGLAGRRRRDAADHRRCLGEVRKLNAYEKEIASHWGQAASSFSRP